MLQRLHGGRTRIRADDSVQTGAALERLASAPMKRDSCALRSRTCVILQPGSSCICRCNSGRQLVHPGSMWTCVQDSVRTSTICRHAAARCNCLKTFYHLLTGHTRLAAARGVRRLLWRSRLPERLRAHEPVRTSSRRQRRHSAVLDLLAVAVRPLAACSTRPSAHAASARDGSASAWRCRARRWVKKAQKDLLQAE